MITVVLKIEKRKKKVPEDEELCTFIDVESGFLGGMVLVGGVFSVLLLLWFMEKKKIWIFVDRIKNE